MLLFLSPFIPDLVYTKTFLIVFMFRLFGFTFGCLPFYPKIHVFICFVTEFPGSFKEQPNLFQHKQFKTTLFPKCT